MKNIITIVLALTLALFLVACGDKDNNSTPSESSNDDGKIDVTEAAENIVEEAIEGNSFSEAAANAWLKKNAGLGKTEIEPAFAYKIDESLMTTYGDSPDSAYGHASIMFIDEDGELADDEYLAWAQKVYDATAKISDDGKNINGYNTGGEGADPNAGRSFDEAMGVGSDAWIIMQGWCYRYNGNYMWVNIEKVEDPNKESETETVDGQITLKYYYYAGKVDISVGLQKSLDDTMSDVEDAFEEHGDEIKDALESAQ